MKTWRGIAADMAALSDGAAFIRNASFDIEGEMRRRMALSRTLTSAGGLGMLTYGAPNGGQYVVLFTTSGTVELVEATP